MTATTSRTPRDTYSQECNDGRPQSCEGYDPDGDLCEHPSHDDRARAYAAVDSADGAE